MLKLMLVAVGGGIGSTLRFGLAMWLQRPGPSNFPIGTFAVNVLGCLAIGILIPLVSGPGAWRDEWRCLLVVGLLGGFTTFSAFGLDAFELARGGQIGRAALYVVVTNALCLGAVWLGHRLATMLPLH